MNYSVTKSDLADAVRTATKEMGYPELRGKQETILMEYVGGRDTFVSLPTGSGKSLCYCALPFVFDKLRKTQGRSIALVVNPLIALMKDQVSAMSQRSVRAAYIGELDEDGIAINSLEISQGKYQLIFVSPESLLTDLNWRDMLQSPVFQENLVAFVVDEAHCVTKWGETFRKEFANLGEVRSLIPKRVRMMALTATATAQTRKNICKILGMVNPVVVTESPNKPNIKYILIRNPGTLEETFAPLVEEVRRCRQATDKTIIFCRTYDHCARIYLYMKSRLNKQFTEPIGAPDLARFRLIDMFSACTHPDVKEAVIGGFCLPHSDLRVVIATIAFGMGIDCPNVRRVIHWGPSADVELYLQETGRAGRDMLPAQAILYHGGEGVVSKNVNDDMKEYCSSKHECRRQLLLKHFDNSPVDPCVPLCLCCDVCEQNCTCRICSNNDC